MENLFTIPVDLLRDQIWVLLDARDIVKLDSAVLCRTKRSHLLTSFKQAGLHSTSVLEVDKPTLSWLFEKHMCVARAELCGRLTDEDLRIHVPVLHKLESVKISGCIGITDAGIATLLQQCPSLRSLEIYTCFSITPAALRHAKGHSLRELRITQCPTLDDATFTELIVECPNLQVIAIEGCFALTDVSVRVVSLMCTQLREFIFKFNKLITAQSVAYLAQNCTTLKKIVGQYALTSMTNQGTQPEFHGVLVDLARSCPLLEHVELDSPFITAAQLTDFSFLCPHLHTFSIGQNYHDLGNGLRSVMEHCRQLRSLNMAYLCLGVATLWDIQSHCTLLTTLHLPNIQCSIDDELHKIWKRNPHLHTLVLEAMAVLKGEAFSDTNLDKSSLTSLDVSETYQLQPQHLIALFPQILNLKYLNLSTNYVSADILLALGQHCTQLESLDLTQCKGVDDAGLMALSAHCTTLTSLRLNGCKATDAGFVALLSKCPRLQLLDLSWCVNMRDATALAIAAHCTALTTLKLSSASLTAAAFHHVAARRRRLQKVVLRCCAFVDDACLAALAEHCARLEDVFVSDSEVITHEGMHVFTCNSHRLLRAAIQDCVQVTQGGPAIYFMTS